MRILILCLVSILLMYSCEPPTEKKPDEDPPPVEDSTLVQADPGFKEVFMNIDVMRNLLNVDGAEGLRIYNVSPSALTDPGTTGSTTERATLMVVAINADGKELAPEEKPYFRMDRVSGDRVTYTQLNRTDAQSSCLALTSARYFNFCCDFYARELSTLLDYTDCDAVSVALTKIDNPSSGSPEPRKIYSMLMKVYRTSTDLTDPCPDRVDAEGVTSNYPCPIVCGTDLSVYLHMEE